MSRPGTTAVALDGLGHTYPGALRPVLADLNLSVPVGEHIAVVGRSGCGKSTLLSVIAGLVEPTTGTAAVLDERRPARRLESCALMPQGDSLLPWLSLLDNVAISLRNQRVRRRVARSEAQRMLDRVGLGAWSDARPSALSAGMRQRAALARALLARKPVLLADEPLGALDAITRAEVQQWLRDTITHTSATLVMVTHDVDEALLLAERVVLLARDEADAPARVVRTWPGWFGDDRPREVLLGDEDFAAARREVLQALARESHLAEGGTNR
ncbi:ABC transporter ATP-binding protein [Dietzia maris]|uniref:ABC transporter ATP-binding protein n=1 Tax=Dietzia TaxID=37914 RepID=UPI001F3BFD5D|nr:MULTISPECIES: ATP-binding cassette domain-containing protein [Dietzia]MCZ4540046.1 ATP-binding cassette domain-containing protein [Dietzia maris]MCZ4655608.1 ATP-binding cassette domain-containing protein [Dietzia kunjamensis]MDJ0422068.1 ATP-binding cassette domain-containing protein [Dietzia kunjamensis]MDV3356067.1 ATP-binding cassette domain-containing protein [Dietzia sp. IN118]